MRAAGEVPDEIHEVVLCPRRHVAPRHELVDQLADILSLEVRFGEPADQALPAELTRDVRIGGGDLYEQGSLSVSILSRRTLCAVARNTGRVWEAAADDSASRSSLCLACN